MIRGIAAIASTPVASDAATSVLEAGGSAADAIIAGFFGAAGESPGVLFSPITALVVGGGAGTRAFDGRTVQPGLGAPRPRGFVDEASVPDAARVAAPRSIAMLTLLHTARGRVAMSTLARYGVTAAERVDEKARASLLRKIGASGVLALRGADIQRALLAAAGPVALGILTQKDFEEALPADTDAAMVELEGGTAVFTSPWPPPESSLEAATIVACDGRGLLAALAYVPARTGVVVPELGISLSLSAVPVRRGVTRVPPGTPLAAPAPIAILTQKGGFSAAIGLPGWSSVDTRIFAPLSSGLAVETALNALREQSGSHTAMAAVTDGRTARAIKS